MYEEGLPAGMSSRDYDIECNGAVLQSDGSYLHDDGSIMWYNEEGCYHREDGPAIILSFGRVEWCLNSEAYEFAEWLFKLNKTDEQKMLLRLRYV